MLAYVFFLRCVGIFLGSSALADCDIFHFAPLLGPSFGRARSKAFVHALGDSWVRSAFSCSWQATGLRACLLL